MHVLVSCKTTNLDVHGESIRRKISSGLLSESHLERLQEDHRQHHASLETLLRELEKHNISYVEVGRGLYWPDLSGVDGVITLGGDGTVLEASHHISDENIPVLGVRSSDMSVGFLCSCKGDGIPGMIQKLATGQFQTREVSRLEAKVRFTDTGGEMTTEPILNDFLYTNKNPAATTRYKVMLGDTHEVHKSSGIWLSTAAGSTAAISAAGGTPVDFYRDDFQFLVREPYTPPSSSKYKIASGFFDPDKTDLIIENHCDQAVLALDGQRGSVSLNFGDTLKFSRAEPLHLIKNADS